MVSNQNYSSEPRRSDKTHRLINYLNNLNKHVCNFTDKDEDQDWILEIL